MEQSGRNQGHTRRWISFSRVLKQVALLLLLSLLLTPVIAADNPPLEIPETSPADEETAGNEKDALLDRHKRQVDTQVQRAANWVDSFFQEPNYEAEVATSQFRIRPELHYRNEQGAKARVKISLKLRLPNIDNRISLVVGSDTEDNDFDDPSDEPGDNSIIGLQFFGKQNKNWHSSLSTGIKFNDFAFFVGPRVSYQKAFGATSAYRLTQTIRWQTNNDWQINSRLDLNHTFGDRFFFRQTFDGRWRGDKSEEEGYRTQVSSFLTQRLKRAAGLQYEFSTIFHTRPDTHVDRYTLSLRFRKRTRREWLYYEIAPEVSFEDEFDYQANPGIRLRVELFYGAESVNRFYKRELEDSGDFRW